MNAREPDDRTTIETGANHENEAVHHRTELMPTASISVETVQQALTFWSVETEGVTDDAPSPGRIDGRWGRLTRRALHAYITANRPGRLNLARVLAPLRTIPVGATEIELERVFVGRLHTHALLWERRRSDNSDPPNAPDATDENEENEPRQPTPRTPTSNDGKPKTASGSRGADGKNPGTRQRDTSSPRGSRTRSSSSVAPILGGFALLAVTLLGAAALSKKRTRRRQRRRTNDAPPEQ